MVYWPIAMKNIRGFTPHCLPVDGLLCCCCPCLKIFVALNWGAALPLVLLTSTLALETYDFALNQRCAETKQVKPLKVSSIKALKRRKSMTKPQGLSLHFHTPNLLLERWEDLAVLIEAGTMLTHQLYFLHLEMDTVEWDTVSTHTYSAGCPGDISPKLIWKTRYKPMARCIKPQDDH